MIKIVSRHPGAIEWLREKGFEGEVIPHLDTATVREGDVVIGVLPIPLAKEVIDKGAEFILLSLPQICFQERGKELSPGEMDKAGAKLHRVLSIEMEEVVERKEVK